MSGGSVNPATLSGADLAVASFVPQAPGRYGFEVTADDGRLRSPPARVDVTRLIGSLALAVALCAPLAALATAAPHAGNSMFNGGCSACHIGHNAPGTTLTKTTTELALCSSCHSSLSGPFGFPWGATEQATAAGSGTSHSYSTSVVNTTHDSVNPGTFPLGTGNVMQCTTCHDPHGTSVLKSGTMHSAIPVNPPGKATCDTGSGYTCGDLTLTTVSAGAAAAAYVIWVGATAGQFKISHDNGQTWLGYSGGVWGNYSAGKPFTANSPQTLDDGSLVQVTFSSTLANQRWVGFYVGYPFLRVDNSAGALCNSCHTARVRTVFDVEGNGTVVPNGTNTFSHPVGATLSKSYDRTVGTNGPILDADGSTNDGNVTNDLKLGTGSVVTCMTCHHLHETDSSSNTTDNWIASGAAVTCTSCHGDATRTTFDTASPPKDTCGNTATSGGTLPNRVGAHATHLTGVTNISNAVACNECHVSNGAGGVGHPGAVCSTARAPVDFGSIAKGGDGWDGAKVPAWDPTTQGCGSTYCHGNFRPLNNTAAVSWNTTILCNGCHGIPPGNAVHSGQTTCDGCHTGYTTTSANLTTHINGKLEVKAGCLDCHTTAAQGPRRALSADFTKTSHHAGNAGATMGGTLTNNDCIVCHAEGTVSGGQAATTPLHKDGACARGKHCIDLRSADNVNAYFQYDKTQVCVDSCVAAGGALATCQSNCDIAPTTTNPTPWGSAAVGAWHSGTATWRQEMSGRNDDLVGVPAVSCSTAPPAPFTSCSKGLDRFCLTCHDSDGASALSTLWETGATQGNPFNDGKITNESDQAQRPSRFTSDTATGSLVDIASKVVAGATDIDLDGNAINDPPNGAYSRHAIRGQALSRYKSYTVASIYNRGVAGGAGIGFVQRGTDATGRPNWNDMSVMDCADCHAVDGANGANGNAHGANSEYILKDAAGNATEGTNAGQTYVCWRCHPYSYYNTGGNGQHTGSGSDWKPSEGSTGSARVTSSGNWAGFACTNCHGTVLSNTSPDFGGIHGNTATIGTGANGASTPRKAYRFLSGASLRFYDPGTWTQLGQTCWTLNSKAPAGAGGADSWGGCTQHGGGAGTKNKAFTRPLTY